MNLSDNDILFAAALALIITFMINRIWVIVSNFKISHRIELDYPSTEANKALQKCYVMFPRDVLTFKGSTYKRGMLVRIITAQNKTIEGKIIGLNSENILCVITKNYIVAHELDFIEEMTHIN